MNNTFSITEAISFGWNTFKSSWKFWTIVVFLVWIGNAGMNFNLPAGSSSSNTPVVLDELYDYEGSYNSEYDLQNTGLDAVLGSNTTRLLSSVIDQSSVSNTPEIITPKALIPLLVLAIPLIIMIFAFALFSVLVSTTLKMGYINLVTDAARGKEVFYRTLMNQVSLKRSYRFLAASFLAGLVSILGLFLFIIPGIYLFLKYAFVGFALVDGDLRVQEALKRSAQLTKGIKLKLLGLHFALFFLTVFSGIFTLGVGFIVMTVVSSLALAYVYVKMADQEASHTL